MMCRGIRGATTVDRNTEEEIMAAAKDLLEKMIAASREDTIQAPAQWYLFEYFLRKLEGSILAVGSGNHDAWTRKVAGIDKVADLATKLRGVSTGQGGRITLRVGDNAYPI